MEVAKQLSSDTFGHTLPLSRSTIRSVTNSPDGFYNEHSIKPLFSMFSAWRTCAVEHPKGICVKSRINRKPNNQRVQSIRR